MGRRRKQGGPERAHGEGRLRSEDWNEGRMASRGHLEEEHSRQRNGQGKGHGSRMYLRLLKKKKMNYKSIFLSN